MPGGSSGDHGATPAVTPSARSSACSPAVASMSPTRSPSEGAASSVVGVTDVAVADDVGATATAVADEALACEEEELVWGRPARPLDPPLEFCTSEQRDVDVRLGSSKLTVASSRRQPRALPNKFHNDTASASNSTRTTTCSTVAIPRGSATSCCARWRCLLENICAPVMRAARSRKRLPAGSPRRDVAHPSLRLNTLVCT